MNKKTNGIICGSAAAISYGTNPLGALSLYASGITPNSVLFYRYGLAAIMLAGIMLIKRESFGISHRELGLLSLLGVMFGASSLSLYVSFNYMDAGIASTILFVYPVMVAVIMAIFFKEKVSIVTFLSITLALSGIALLYRGGDGATLNSIGVLLVLLSSLTYALYIVIVDRAALHISPFKMTFYVLLIGLITILLYSIINSSPVQILNTPSQWAYAAFLALFPTVISLIMMNMAIGLIGSTKSAILGALEPITAVIIGVAIFNEAFTARLALGIVLVLSAVILIIVGKTFSLQRLFSLH